MRSLLISYALFPLLLPAQEHPFIAAYGLTALEGGIRIDWTIQGGSTCNGLEVERSADGVQFLAVHRIDGICGDPAIAVPFAWFDDAPPEFSTVYYRVKLGVDGYTSVKSVFFDQLTSSEMRFFPSPMGDVATLVLNIPGSSKFDLRIWDASGKMVFERTDIPGASTSIVLPAAARGAFRYRATSSGRSFTGGFVKQ
jgi:hypothetical protein